MPFGVVFVSYGFLWHFYIDQAKKATVASAELMDTTGCLESFVDQAELAGEIGVALDVIKLCSYILEQLGPFCLNDASCLLKKEISEYLVCKTLPRAYFNFCIPVVHCQCS